MKKVFLSILIIAAFIVLPVSVFAQVSGTTQVTATYANVIDALTLSPAATGLDFGTFTPGNSGGTVVMAPTSATATGTRTATGTVDLITGTTTPTCATYTVTGTKGAAYTVTIPSSAVTLTNSGTATGTVTMSLSTFTIFLDALGDTGGTLDASAGTSAFSVGGTLAVASAQTAGSYVGSFDVTVAYN